MLSERHEADEQVKVLKQQLDDANLKVKLEKHRCTVSVNRTKVLEKEIEFFKDQHVRNKQKTQELEERNRTVVKEVSVVKHEVQKYKDKVSPWWEREREGERCIEVPGCAPASDAIFTSVPVPWSSSRQGRTRS